jgi:CheY-like chemotaxis protein
MPKPSFLWVEDRTHVLHTFQEDLAADGWIIVRMAGVKAARERLLALAEGAQYDLLVVDLLMEYAGVYDAQATHYGRLTGLSFAAEVRAGLVPRLAGIPIIFLTNTVNVEPEVNEWMQANQPSRYLVKVPTLAEFEQVATELLPQFPWGASDSEGDARG